MVETSPEQALSQIERDQLAVYVRYGDTPRWVWPFFGISTFILFATYGLDLPYAVTLAVALGYAAAVGVVAGKLMTKAGMQPRLRSMPGPLRRTLFVFWAIGTIVVGGGFVLGLMADNLGIFSLLGLVAGLYLGVGGWWTTRVYANRARRLADASGVRR